MLFLFCFLFWHRISFFFHSLFFLFFPRRIYNSVILNLKLVSVCCAFFFCGLSRLCHYFHDVKLKQTRLSGDDGRFMLCKCSTYCSSFRIGAFWQHFKPFQQNIYTCILHKTQIDCGKFLVSNLNDDFFFIFRYGYMTQSVRIYNATHAHSHNFKKFSDAFKNHLKIFFNPYSPRKPLKAFNGCKTTEQLFSTTS